jgi:transposase
MIRIDALWLATTPIDMRMGTERLLAQVVQVFGSAQAHHGYLFANARGNRMKLLLHDGFGLWCAARRLNQGGFEWPRGGSDLATSITLTKQQFDALVLGLPWSRLEQMQWSMSTILTARRQLSWPVEAGNEFDYLRC